MNNLNTNQLKQLTDLYNQLRAKASELEQERIDLQTQLKTNESSMLAVLTQIVAISDRLLTFTFSKEEAEVEVEPTQPEVGVTPENVG